MQNDVEGQIIRRRRSTPMIERQCGVPTSLGSRFPLASMVHTLTVTEYLNFRHAANALGVSPVERRFPLEPLEEGLGILLFERHARGIQLKVADRLTELVSLYHLSLRMPRGYF
jgi:hypothetical protein